MINIKGIIKCIFEEVFEEVQNYKGVYTEKTPFVLVLIRNEEIIVEDKDQGLTCGMYDAENKLVFIFEDSLNEIFRKENVYEEAIIVRTLAHELTHFLQDINGEAFDDSLPYKERPHEIEAFDIANKVCEKYLIESSL